MAAPRVVAFTAMNPKEYIFARDATIVWEPSVFGGDGTEKRLNLVLRVADHVRGVLRSIETDAALERLCTVVHDDTIKVKLDIETVRVWDTTHLPTSAPEQWKGLVVHAAIEVRGSWSTRTGAGLSAVCTDIQLVDAQQPPACPFLETHVARTLPVH